MPLKTEITSYLEMTAPTDLIAAREPAVAVEVKRAEVVSPELNRFLYTAVGGDYWWVDRLGHSYADWLALLAKPGYETWVAYVAGTPAGYFELDGQAGGDVEIAFFGVLPQFLGRGVGGHLLTAAVRRAWEKGAKRVWLHTSSFDHAHALGNYQARGFRLVRREESVKELPAEPPGSWPGANRPARP
jgi:ribosomal protein S18 acetylase RimI-like enzyme